MTKKIYPIYSDAHTALKKQSGGSAEAKLYELLREKLPDDWMVIHNSNVYGRENENQIDFLLIVPGIGVMNIECKGKGYSPIGTNGNFQWDGDGTTKQPLQQAEKAIINFAKDARDKGFNIGYYSYMVFFPENVFPGCEFEGAIFDAKNSDNIMECIINTFEATKNRVFQKPSFTQEDAQRLYDRYTREYKVKYLESNPNLQVNERLMGACLTTMQQMVIQRIRTHRDTIVTGAAGTGKTWIASYVARDYAARGNRVLLVCFNENLACELTIRLEGTGVLVSHYHRLPYVLFNQNLCRTGQGGQFLDDETDQAFQKYVAYHPLSNDKKFDLLLIDEGQDFNDKKITFLLSLVKDDDNSKIALFGDQNQRIYRREWRMDELRELDEHNEVFNLPTNLRNTQHIYSYCAPLIDDNETQPCEDILGPEVIKESMTTEAFRTWLDQLVSQQYAIKASELAVLADEKALLDSVLPNNLGLQTSHFSFRGYENSSFEEKCKGLRNWHNSQGNHPWKGTIHAFKGLEADYVIILSRTEVPYEKMLHYVGASRPTYLLALVQISECNLKTR